MHTFFHHSQIHGYYFSGSIRYSLPNKKAVAIASRIAYMVKMFFVFVVFHAGKEFAVKNVRTMYVWVLHADLLLYRLYTDQRRDHKMFLLVELNLEAIFIGEKNDITCTCKDINIIASYFYYFMHAKGG